MEPATTAKAKPATRKEASPAATHTATPSVVQGATLQRKACACGGGCPRCNPNRSAVSEESRAHAAVDQLAATPAAVGTVHNLFGDRQLPDGTVSPDVRRAVTPFTGALPADLTLRTGADVDRTLMAQHARGIAI